MTDDVKTAFAHPERRAAAMTGDAGGDPPDRLLLRDHVTQAEIGAFHEERGRRQRLRFNIAVELAPRGGAGDDVDRILSYDRLVEAVEAELRAERLNLLETLAERVAGRILAEPQARRVFLRVEKLDRGPHALGVEIVRSAAAAAAPQATPTAAARPLVHLVAADRAADLARATDAGAAAEIFVLAPAAAPLPPAAGAEARLRIALLAVEQAAWAFADARRDVAVIATRTELDWAMRQGRRAAWAPSKLILDTPGAPQSAEIGVIGAWLAESIGARGIVTHGTVAVPAECRVPQRAA